jgi:hypothetical protein
MRCRKGCGAKVMVQMSDLQEETLGDAIECGSSGDGWDLYRELLAELNVLCHRCEG